MRERVRNRSYHKCTKSLDFESRYEIQAVLFELLSVQNFVIKYFFRNYTNSLQIWLCARGITTKSKTNKTTGGIPTLSPRAHAESQVNVYKRPVFVINSARYKLGPVFMGLQPNRKWRKPLERPQWSFHAYIQNLTWLSLCLYKICFENSVVEFGPDDFFVWDLAGCYLNGC